MKLSSLVVFLGLMSVGFAQDPTDTLYKRPTDTMPLVINWTQLAKGVQYCETDAPVRSIIGDSKLTILRLDADKVDFDLLTATSADKKSRPVDHWADSCELNIVFNAGMYDLSKPLVSRGLLRNGEHYNQAKLHPTFNLMLALNPKDITKPDCAIFDLQKQPYETIKNQYSCFAQGLRMIDGDGNPTRWNKRIQSCSMMVAAQDNENHIYLIFTRSPYIHNQMIDFMLLFPVKLKNAIYLEGGPETSLYVSIGDVCIQKVGSYVSNTYEKDSNEWYWRLPNVIGIKVLP